MNVPNPDDALARRLIELALTTPAELARCQAAHRPGEGLAAVLVREGVVHRDVLAELAVELSTIAGGDRPPRLDTLAATHLAAEPRGTPEAEPGGTDPLVGHVLAGKYRVERRIGRGGMGAVYQARALQLERDCAIKILPADLAATPEYAERFQREARALARLDHPGVVRIHDVDRDGATAFYAMELVRGRSLGVMLREDGPLDWRRAVALGIEAADALAAAHAVSIIHRDLKPDNLLVGPSGALKIVDFGLARLAEARTGLSQAGQVLGTPQFMAPEQARGDDTDARTDVYGLGATLYTLVTGRPPFVAKNPFEVLRMVADTTAPRADTILRSLPASLARAIAQMMAPTPAERPTAVAARAMLAELLELPPTDAPRRGVGRGAVVALGLLVALALGGWAARRIVGRARGGAGSGKSEAGTLQPAPLDAQAARAREQLASAQALNAQEAIDASDQVLYQLGEAGAATLGPEDRRAYEDLRTSLDLALARGRSARPAGNVTTIAHAAGIAALPSLADPWRLPYDGSHPERDLYGEGGRWAVAAGAYRGQGLLVVRHGPLLRAGIRVRWTVQARPGSRRVGIVLVPLAKHLQPLLATLELDVPSLTATQIHRDTLAPTRELERVVHLRPHAVGDVELSLGQDPRRLRVTARWATEELELGLPIMLSSMYSIPAFVAFLAQGEGLGIEDVEVVQRPSER